MLKVTYIYQHRLDKSVVFDEICAKSGAKPEEILFIGDDLPDIQVLSRAGLGIAVLFALAVRDYGVFHLATSDHSSFIGLDAVERNVLRPVLGALQWIAVVFALVTVLVLVSLIQSERASRRRSVPVAAASNR